MKVMCIKETKSSDPVLSSVKLGDWIEVNEKSIYSKKNETNHHTDYFYIKNGEYSFEKSYFITLEEWRQQQLNKIGI